MPSVDIPDVGTVEFPDSMSEGDIKSTIKRKFYIEPALKGLKVSNEAIDRVYRIITNPAAAEASSMGRHETMRAEMEKAQAAGRRAETATTILGGAEKAAGFVAEFSNLPRRALELPTQLEQAAGLLPANTRSPIVPALPLESARKVVDFLDPHSYDEPGSMREGIKQFLAETLSGTTSPDQATAIVLGVKEPELVGRLFQIGAAEQIPTAAQNLSQAVQSGDKTEIGKAAASLAATAAIPAAIEKGLRSAAAPKPTGITPELTTVADQIRETAPATAAALKDQAEKGPDALHETPGTVLPSLRTQSGGGEGQVPVTPSVEETGARSAQAGEQKSQAVTDYERYQQIRQEMRGKAMDQVAPLWAEMEQIKNRYGGAPPPKPIPTVSETTPPVPPEELPQSPTQSGLRPAIRLVGGEVVAGDAGKTHPDIIAENNLKAEEIDQRGFVDEQGVFHDREQAAAKTGLPTEKEAQRLHSTDLPEAKEATPQSAGEQEVKTTPAVEPAIMTGAAHISEIPETGVGGEKYGVAERVREERAKAGQVEPVEPGEGINTQESINRGRAMLQAEPASAERLMSQFEADPQKALSADAMAVARAKGEQLAAKARTVEERSGTDSDEYRAAKDELSAWDKRSKAMQTEWHKTGMAQQGETDIDTGSYTGLERARRETTGKDFTEKQKPRAKKIAADNKNAQDAVDKASEKLNQRIRTKSAPDAEKAALDAAHKTVREAAASKAEAENKARVAQTVRDKEVARIELKRAQKALDAAQKRERAAAVRAAREARRRQGDPSIAVWELARKLLDENKGLYGFDDLRNKIATELNMKPSQVSYWLARDATTKALADDLWIKQRNARRLKEQAKRWLKELDTPGYQKALASIPRAMFSLSVFGHGFVALGTHAPIVAFQPRFWKAYVTNFGKMYKMVFSPAYYEAQMADLVRRPNYERARRAGLQNDPFQYEEFQTSMIRDLVEDWVGKENMDRVDKFASAGNRGYGVLKLLRQDMFDQRYDKLPRTVSVQEGVTEAIADGVNHATGVTKAGAPKGSNILLFAPRLAGSRVMWVGGDPIRAAKTVANWKNATEAERQFAVNQVKEKAWVAGTFASLLIANQGFLSAAGSKQKINGIPESMGGAGVDPLASDFMKFKALGGDIAYGGALLTLAKLPARVATAILYEGKGSKYILEDERVDKVIGSYIRSQMSPFAGTVTDLALGRDYEGRPLPAKMFGTVEQTGKVPKRLQAIGVDEPYNWAEFAATKLPIPLAEGIKEGLRGSGMSEDQAKYWLKAMAITSLMTATGTRITEDTRDEQ